MSEWVSAETNERANQHFVARTHHCATKKLFDQIASPHVTLNIHATNHLPWSSGSIARPTSFQSEKLTFIVLMSTFMNDGLQTRIHVSMSTPISDWQPLNRIPILYCHHTANVKVWTTYCAHMHAHRRMHEGTNLPSNASSLQRPQHLSNLHYPKISAA